MTAPDGSERCWLTCPCFPRVGLLTSVSDAEFAATPVLPGPAVLSSACTDTNDDRVPGRPATARVRSRLTGSRDDPPDQACGAGEAPAVASSSGSTTASASAP